MRTFFFALAAIVPAFAIDRAGAADEPPAFDIVRNCREEVVGGLTSIDSCTNDETDAKNELEHILAELRTDFIDVLTFYYVEQNEEWQEIIAPGGALEFCAAAQRDGRVGMLGVTSHQRRLAAEMAASGLLDLLMIRYNAAHRGAEREIFPVTTERGLPVFDEPEPDLDEADESASSTIFTSLSAAI